MSTTRTSRRNSVTAVAGAYTQVTVTGSATYGQLIASTSTGIYITHVFIDAYGGNANAVTMTVGIGAAASEVAIITAPWGYVSTNNVALNVPLPFPVYVPSGTRVAMKLDYYSTGTMGIVYVAEGSLA